MSKLNIGLILTTGFIIGAAITYIYTKNKYEKITQEEIDSVKEKFSRIGSVKEEPVIRDYVETIEKNHYKTNSDKEVKKDSKPYIISPDEFGELEDYETISLYYYDDGILADGCYDRVENVEETIGLDFFEHFGEYEDDSVFIRNNKLKCDYEILLDHQTYSDVLKSKPYLRKE